MAEYTENDDGDDAGKRELLVYSMDGYSTKSRHDLVKVNRLLLRLVYGLVCLVFILGYLLAPAPSIWRVLARKQAATAEASLVYATENNGLMSELNTLKGQMFSLVSGTVEGKLKSLEDSLRRGNLAESMDAVQELKVDVKLLTDYAPTPRAGSDQAMAEHQRMVRELSELRGLVYLTVLSCGLIVAALAGVWLRHRYRIGYQKRDFLGAKSKL